MTTGAVSTHTEKGCVSGVTEGDVHMQGRSFVRDWLPGWPLGHYFFLCCCCFAVLRKEKSTGPPSGTAPPGSRSFAE
jgi:hypothetical protein